MIKQAILPVPAVCKYSQQNPVHVSSSMFLMVVLICVSRRSTPFRGSSPPQPHPFTVLVDLDHIIESLFEKHSQYEVALCVQHVVCSPGLEMSFASTLVGTKVIVHFLAAAVASATCRATSPASRRAAPRSCRSYISFEFFLQAPRSRGRSLSKTSSIITTHVRFQVLQLVRIVPTASEVRPLAPLTCCESISFCGTNGAKSCVHRYANPSSES